MIWRSNLAKGDESLENFKKAVDDYVAKNGLEVPARAKVEGKSEHREGNTSPAPEPES